MNKNQILKTLVWNATDDENISDLFCLKKVVKMFYENNEISEGTYNNIMFKITLSIYKLTKGKE